MEKEQRQSGPLKKEWLSKKERGRSRCAKSRRTLSPLRCGFEPSGKDHAQVRYGSFRDVGRILEENDCGFTVSTGDGEALTERILALAGDRDLSASLGARARMAFERQWDKEQALAEWEALLQAVGHMPL